MTKPARDEELQKCVVCGSPLLQEFARHRDGDTQLRYVACRACGLVLMSPRPSRSELQRFYRRGYRELQHGTETPTDHSLEIQRLRGEHLASLIFDGTWHPASHLDIGSASGGLLQTVRCGGVRRSVGVEPTDTYRAAAEAAGFVCYPALDDIPRDDRFDVVTMSHVLEHLPDPLLALRKVREELLSDAGRLIVEVPNLVGHTTFEPAHLLGFTAASLRSTLAAGGFSTRRLKRHSIPAGGLAPKYLTAICEPADAKVEFATRPLWLTRWERSAGLAPQRLKRSLRRQGRRLRRRLRRLAKRRMATTLGRQD